MAFEVGAIVGELELRKDRWNQAIREVKADSKSLRGMVLRNSQQFKQMGRAMTVAGAAIIGSVGLMVKAYATFDQSMTESLAIMGNVSPAMRKEMEKTAKDMSTKSTFAAEKLAGAYFFLASAGMDAAQSIKALPVVAKFAQAGAFNLAAATDLLTDAQTALGLSSKDAVENQKNLIRVSDVLVGANTLANASVKQFAESLTNKASAALVNVNKEVEEGVAVLAAYADKGIKGQLAGQRLTMMLNGLFDATRRNKKAWDEAGISLWEADGSMRSIADIVQDMEGYLGVMTVKQREAALAALGFNLRTKDSILTLMGSSEKIRKWTADLKEMGGKTEEVSDKQLQTLNNQLKLLKNTAMAGAISIGKSLGPAIKDLTEDIKNVVAKVSTWVEEHPKLTALIAKSAVAIGGLLAVLGPLAMMLPGLVMGLGLLKGAMIALQGPTGVVATTVAGLVGWVVMLGVGIKAIVDEVDRWEKESVNYVHTAKLQSAALNEMGINLEETRKAAGYSRKEFEKLRKEYDMDDVALARAIMHGDEGLTLQRALVETSVKRAKTKREETEAVEEAAEAQKAENELMAEALALYEKWKTPTRVEAFLAKLEEFREGLKIPILIEDPQELLKDTEIAEGAEFFRYEWEKSMYGAEEASNQWLNTMIGAIDDVKAGTEDAGKTQIDMLSMLGMALSGMGTHSKALAYAGAIISTAHAITKALPNLPLAFIVGAMGATQVATIAATDIPSAEKGAYLPSPAIIEAGHGTWGEVVLPLDRAPIDFMGAATGGGDALPMSMRIIIQNRIVIGEQTFYRETVKNVNTAGVRRDIKVPNEVVF